VVPRARTCFNMPRYLAGYHLSPLEHSRTSVQDFLAGRSDSQGSLDTQHVMCYNGFSCSCYLRRALENERRFERRILRGLMLAMSLSLLVSLLPALALADKGDPPSGPSVSAVGHMTITGNPLTIHVAADTSIQVFYAGKPDGQVDPPNYNEADSGAFMWGPPGTYAFAIGTYLPGHDLSSGKPVIPWVPGGQSAVSGSGTAADPWRVTTTVSAGAVNIAQWIRYVDGDDCFRVMYTVNHLESSGAEGFTFFHAADLWPDDSTGGFGYYDAATGSVGAWNQDMTFLEYFVPVLQDLGFAMPPANHYQEAGYQVIWDSIVDDALQPGPGFDDTVVATPFHDSGCGLQWDLNFPGVATPFNFIEFGTDWCFLAAEEPEFVPEPGSVMLLASGLMGLAGYAGLRMRKR